MFKRFLIALADALAPPTVSGATSGFTRMKDRLQRAAVREQTKARDRRRTRAQLQAEALNEERLANLHDAEAQLARRLVGKIDAFILQA